MSDDMFGELGLAASPLPARPIGGGGKIKPRAVAATLTNTLPRFPPIAQRAWAPATTTIPLGQPSHTLRWETEKSFQTLSVEANRIMQSEVQRVETILAMCRDLLITDGQYRGPRPEECICNEDLGAHTLVAEDDDRPVLQVAFHSTERDLIRLLHPKILTVVCRTNQMKQNDIEFKIGGVVVLRIERKAEDLIPSIHDGLLPSEMKTMEMTAFRRCRDMMLIESPVSWNPALDHLKQPLSDARQASEFDLRYQAARSLIVDDIHTYRTQSTLGSAMYILLNILIMLKDGCSFYTKLQRQPHSDPCAGYDGPEDPEALGEEYLKCALRCAGRKYSPGSLMQTASAIMVLMLARISGIGDSAALRIQHTYLSMHTLWKAYVDLSDEREREALLADLVVNSAKSARRLGPKKSKMIYEAFFAEAGPLWKSMLERIPGLGPLKAAKIQEAFPTINALLEAWADQPKPLIAGVGAKDVQKVWSALCGKTESLQDTRKRKYPEEKKSPQRAVAKKKAGKKQTKQEEEEEAEEVASPKRLLKKNHREFAEEASPLKIQKTTEKKYPTPSKARQRKRYKPLPTQEIVMSLVTTKRSPLGPTTKSFVAKQSLLTDEDKPFLTKRTKRQQ